MAAPTSPSALLDGLLQRLDAVLAARPEDPRLAQALAMRLPMLRQLAPDWTDSHRDVLLTLPTDRPTAATLWLRRGAPSPALLADLDRTALLTRLAPAPRLSRWPLTSRTPSQPRTSLGSGGRMTSSPMSPTP